MTFEEYYELLYKKYGNQFNWRPISFSDQFFINELNLELTSNHPLYGKIKWAVARSISNDDVLFLDENNKWYIIHLTYSKSNSLGYPKFKEFLDLDNVMQFIEEEYELDYL